MAKATKTIQHALNHQGKHAAWFTTHQELFNRVAAFYFEVINAHTMVLDLSAQEALSALEKLTHTTRENLNPICPLTHVAEHLPAMFRRAAIHAALGSAHSFFSSLKKWKARKAKAEAKGKKFADRPPVPPRTWRKAAVFYAGMWKERTASTIMLKVWTGTCWSWLKVRTLGRACDEGFELGSPSLIRKGNTWWLHTPVEKKFPSPAKVAEQITDPSTTVCAVDLNLGENIAVCTIQTAKGTILATRFLKGGTRIHGFRKRQFGRIARNRRKTGIIAEGEQDNVALWQQIRHHDETLSHHISARIVQFAKAHGASILVFEHLGHLKPERGKYSRRGNSKRAFWMKGRIFRYAKYKAWQEGIITSRVNPRNTSRECARCHGLVVRYSQGSLQEGYTAGTPLVVCPSCGMRGNADRNASIVIGQRLIIRSQEKPPTRSARQDEETKVSGAIICQDAKGEKGPSFPSSGHADRRGHGTAQGRRRRMVAPSPAIPPQLRSSASGL